MEDWVITEREPRHPPALAFYQDGHVVAVAGGASDEDARKAAERFFGVALDYATTGNGPDFCLDSRFQPARGWWLRAHLVVEHDARQPDQGFCPWGGAEHAEETSHG
jgi:hypothetical protein